MSKKNGKDHQEGEMERKFATSTAWLPRRRRLVSRLS
jgi:hypothetical protein